GAGALRLRRLGPRPAARGSGPPQAGARALRGDVIRAPALLPVRPRGGLAGARLRQRLVRPVADDPARLAAGRDGAPGAGARARLETPVCLGRGPDARALLPRGQMVAGGARRGAARGARRRRGRGSGTHDPAGKRARPLRVAADAKAAGNAETRGMDDRELDRLAQRWRGALDGATVTLDELSRSRRELQLSACELRWR